VKQADAIRSALTDLRPKHADAFRQGYDALLRTRNKRPIRDVRPLGEVIGLFEPYHFLRIDHDFAVNLRRIRRISPRVEGADWQLLPPVNRLLPVSRTYESALWRAFND
jgi:hypothetical protein